MFSSASSCTPNSQVTVSFVADKNQTLDISPSVTIAVDSVVIPTRPIAIQAGQQVTAIVTSPLGFLQYEFFEYTLDNQKSYFAVVNKNNYQPIVKSADAPKKWFNYFTTDIKVSFYNGFNSFQHPLGFGRSIVDIGSSHIVLDHINNAVSFYGTNQSMITRVVLPAGPIEYRKYSYVIPQTGITTTEALILCTNNRLYRIRFDNQYFDSDTFTPTVIPVISLGNLWFEQDLPTGETFIEANQKRLLSKLSPALTALDIGPDKIWVAGFDSIFILGNNFQLINSFKFRGQTIVAIAVLGDDAIVTNRLGQVFHVTASGQITPVHSAAVLGVPASINNGQAVVIPDPNNRRLLVFTDSSGSYSTWDTDDFAPAYARVFDGSLWLTGYDTNTVLKFNSPTEISRFDFDYKVTVVSVISGSILGVNYLENFVTLDLTGIEKVIPIKFKARKGPRSHVGADPEKITCLGQEAVMPKTSPGLTSWVNGLKNELVKTGDYVGVSYRGESIGTFRSVLILGETAIDYDVEIASATKTIDYYYPGLVAYQRLPASGNISLNGIFTGNADIGTNETISLPFTLNMYGNLYSTVGVTTNGYITFDGNLTNQNASTIGSLGIDALYVEPRDLYQGLPVNNTDPLDISYSPLASGESPGVYYQSGTLGQFSYLRLRWVGTTMAIRPTGTEVTVGVGVVNSTEIPVDRISDVRPNDFISGNGITISTQVVSTNNYGPVTVNAYAVNSVGNYLLVSRTLLLGSIKKNSWATVDGIAKTYITGTEALTIRRTGLHVDTILDVDTNNLIINGSVLPTINNEYTVLITLSNFLIQRKSDILNITVNSESITCINVIDTTTLEVSAGDYSKIYVSQEIIVAGTNSGIFVVAKTAIDGQYLITLTGNHNLIASDVFEIKSTTISFNTSVSETALINSKVGFELNKIFVTDASVFSIVQDTSVTIQGNFIVVNRPLTVSANDQLLCAQHTPVVPDYTFEVGFYSDGNYQYLEYFYDNSYHDSLTPIGIATSNTNYLPLVTSAFSGNSVVFFSESATGIWTSLGPGSFDANSRGFIPRNFIPEFVTSPEINTTTVQILIDQNIQASSNVLISASYGFLTVNNASYFGQNYITKDSLITLRVPFNDSLRSIAPIISIDSQQIAIPMKTSVNSEFDLDLVLPTNITNYLSAPLSTLVEEYINVPVSDSYFIPDYYRGTTVSAENDLNYFLISNGNTILLDKGQNYEFAAGDVIWVKNIITSPSIYDNRNALLVGPVILGSNWRTVGPDLIDTIVFDTLVGPYQSNSEYILDGGVVYDVGYRLYESSPALISSNSSFNCNLFVDTYGSGLVVNQNPVPSYWATNVPVGSTIALTRDVFNLLQQPIKLYQVFYDNKISSNVFVEVGQWEIQNQITTGTDILETQSISQELDQQLDTSDSELLNALTNELELINQIKVNFNQAVVDSAYTLNLESIKFDGIVDSAGYSIFSIGLDNDMADLNSRATYIDSLKISVDSIPDNSNTTLFLSDIKVEDYNAMQTFIQGKIDNDLFVSDYRSSWFNERINADSVVSNNLSIAKNNYETIPLNYKSSLILESVVNNTLVTDYKNSLLRKSVVNVSKPINYKLSETTTFLQNNNLPLNYLSSNYQWSIKNDTRPINYLSSNYQARIVNNRIALNYRSSNVFDKIDNNFLTLNYKLSELISQIVNSPVVLDRNLSWAKSRIVNSSTVLNWKITSAAWSLKNIDLNLIWKSSWLKGSSLSDLNLAGKKSLSTGKITNNTGPIRTTFFKYRTPVEPRVTNEKLNWLIGSMATDIYKPYSLFYGSAQSQSEQTFSLTQSDIKIEENIFPVSLFAGKNYSRYEISTDPLNHDLSSLGMPTPSIIRAATKEASISGMTLLELNKLDSTIDIRNALIVGGNDPVWDQSLDYYSDKLEVDLIQQTYSGLSFEADLLSTISDSFTKINPAYSQHTEIYKLFDPATFQSTEINHDFSPIAMQEYQLIHLPLVGIPDNVTQIKKSLIPIVENIPPIVLPLLPLWDRETIISKDLINQFDKETQIYQTLTRIIDDPTQLYQNVQLTLDNEPIWEPDELNRSAAYRTVIKIYADNGRGGDNLTDKGNPPSRLPFVLYSQEYNYMYSSYSLFDDARFAAEKFNSALAIPIVATDYWNYRIYFNKKHYCVPKKGRVFPTKWYIRGG